MLPNLDEIKRNEKKLFQRLLPILRYSQDLQDQNEHIHSRKW